ncbi:hypothetical protein V1478_001956 [Vespula squamosa]|uniref:Uncharacterized protein n=1 Tax=Vespula squamosa TaxID=30214 RepID=A0ABD2BYL8_VESSQ
MGFFAPGLGRRFDNATRGKLLNMDNAKSLPFFAIFDLINSFLRNYYYLEICISNLERIVNSARTRSAVTRVMSQIIVLITFSSRITMMKNKKKQLMRSPLS